MKNRESPIRTKPQNYSGNKSGFIPFENKILVLPDFIDETSEGGIVLTSDTVKQNELAITEGFLVDWGGTAFSDFETWPDPHHGERIVWAQYSGQMLEGVDGVMYRLINDTDIVARHVL